MKIQTIEITNYKAFYGTHKISVSGKNCEKNKKVVVFKSRLKNYNTQDFWQVVKEDVSPEMIKDIERYRTLVLNPFSHYDTEQHEIRKELQAAVQAVKKLKDQLNKKS